MTAIQTETRAHPTLSIATGKSRMTKQWRNTEVSWETLLQRLTRTTRTRESMAEFLAMSRAQQDEVKDIGGFVGGSLSEGRRKASAVRWRSLLTLDVDFAPENFEALVRAAYGGVAWCLYSTHKHRPDAPRLRLVLPLRRAAKAEEYEAAARRVAGRLGIEFFDDTTYEAHRLMYWPSTPADGTFFSAVSDAADWLDTDAVLAEYGDWTDRSLWPRSDRQDRELKKRAAKQQDPCEKKGLVGAFCRTYDIDAAIGAFLPEVYEPAGEGRYTYKAGSTSAGAIVYEGGKFLYSHHGTDPASGQLVNAFDLVRLHRFGEKDDEAAPKTPAPRLPSYLAMAELARRDARVAARLVTDRIQEASEEFRDEGGEEAPEGKEETAWKGRMKLTAKGVIVSCAKNVRLILENDPRLRETAALDLFDHRVHVVRDLPWRKAEEGRYWSNGDDSCLRNYLDDLYGIQGRMIIEDAFREVVGRHTKHAVRDYLSGLCWDGRKRLDTLLIDYLGAEDTPFTRQVTRKALTAAVARVMRPGIKFDYVLTLIGAQGLGKTLLWKRLGRAWTSDSLCTVTGREAMEQIQGAWILELAELAALRKAELESVKQFITKQIDSFRPAYGREVEHHPRQCIFVATTNLPDFIRDQTGGRRWWPVTVGVREKRKSLFDDACEKEMDQVWAEAVLAYEAGETLYPDEGISAEVQTLQEAHTEEIPGAGLIRAYLDVKLPENWTAMTISNRRAYIRMEMQGDRNVLDPPEGGPVLSRTRVCVMEVWIELFGGEAKYLTRAQAKEISAAIARTPGWLPTKNGVRFGPYGFQRGFVREDILGDTNG